MFINASPESVGIGSARVRRFLETLESYGYDTHSIIMARGDKIFAEAYYAPYDKDSLHRMYSVSKSFVSIAAGAAIDDGILSLDSRLVDLLSEYAPDLTDELLCRVTVRDLLSMRSSMATDPAWWGAPDRVAAYFKQRSTKVPNTNFHYDSAGSFLVAAIIEKLTGKPYIEYMKDKFLRRLGFSEESYSLLAPGGHSHADSALMCKARDLLTFGRLVINEGYADGEQLVSRDYVRTATSKLSDCLNAGDVPTSYCDGYGYLFWTMPDGCYCCVGMADQYIFFDPKNDFIFTMTSENMDVTATTRPLLFHMIFNDIRPYLGEPLPECPEEYKLLTDYMASRELAHHRKTEVSPIACQINGVTYAMSENPIGIKTLRLELSEREGAMVFENADGECRIEFGIGYNKFGKFPGKRRMSNTASVYEDGAYDSAASAEWIEPRKLKITARVIDTFLGKVVFNLGFEDDCLSLTSVRHAQRILDGYSFFAVGKKCKPQLE